MAARIPESDPVNKVTIIPRGRALGLTHFLPKEDKYKVSKTTCMAQIAVGMGGRVAEEIVFNEITSGAKGDIDMSTNLARRMVCEWGMSDRLGPIALGRGDEEVFLGREIIQNRHVSEETAEAIDAEVRNLVEAGRTRAHEILTKDRELLDSIAMALLERETLDEEEFALLVAGDPLPAVKPPAEEGSTDSAPASTSPGGAAGSVGEAPAG